MRSASDVVKSLASKDFKTFKKSEPIKDVKRWAEWFGFDLREGSPDQPQMEAMVKAAAQFGKDMKLKFQPYWLSLLGSSGVGKTYLARRLDDWYRKSGLFHDETVDGEVVYAREFCEWPGLAKELKNNGGQGRLDDLSSARFVVIDEIGAELDKSGHVTNCLANLLCSRVGKWTIITSNRSLKDIGDHLDGRVASRMIRDGSVVVDVDVKDYALWRPLANPPDPGSPTMALRPGSLAL